MPANEGIDAKLFDYICNSVKQAQYYQLLGIELQQIGPGWAVLGVTPGIQHTNPLAMVHGGLIMSLGDAAMGNAIRTLGIKAVTASLNIEFMRPAPLECSLTARGDVIKTGSKLVFARTIVEADGKLIAAASGTFYVTGQVIDHE